MFRSLAVAMAVVSQGNMRTAETHLRVTRALGAVDTGMELAESRLAEAAARFVVAKGEIDADYAEELWYGTYDDEPVVIVLPPADGRAEDSLPDGIAEALEKHHAADDGDNIAGAITLPTPPEGWVIAPPIGLARTAQGQIVTAVQITYVPPDAEGRILVIATGYDWDYSRETWVTRTAQQDFSITKTVKHAVLGPSRMMIGRNVQVTGPLGVRYDSAALDTLDGPPLVVRSDFLGLSPELDAKLEDFYGAVLSDDTDGDNRLRTGHAIESQSLAGLNLTDYDGDEEPDAAFLDLTSDGIVDEYDVFLRHFDSNGDGRVVLSAALTEGTAHAGESPEFELDNALASLIDSGLPDRNGNGRSNGELVLGDWDWDTFDDNNGDGIRDVLDMDTDDVVLGYRDGVLDYRDRYSKIRGTAYFRAGRDQWETSHDEFGEEIGDYQQFVQGSIVPERGDQPVIFDASDAEVPEFTTEHFAAATLTLIDGADGTSFAQQVDEQWGDDPIPTLVESTPFGSPSPADWYLRPVYQDMVFKDVTIPMGTNALFINCTFVGVTHVEAYTDNTHASWSYYGQQERDVETGDLFWKYPPPPADSETALDKSYSEEGAPGYEELPDPLMVDIDLNKDGSTPDQCTNTKQLSNNLRFHDCLFVGSIVADTPQNYTQVRNKIQFTGATRFTTVHPTEPENAFLNPDPADLNDILSSSMMLPNYSVDIGTFNSPPEQDVRLHGAIIAGVLDARGNTEIVGTLLLTFDPTFGEGPLQDVFGNPVGNPAGFNASLGYFGTDDGDFESVDPADLPLVGGVPIVGWDTDGDGLV
ncbi:MAG: hypothetical protein KDA21_02345, partial [Phycisphaerales bacterium]|nr:hypothetical protein [Phycisphaerales bacterium]